MGWCGGIPLGDAASMMRGTAPGKQCGDHYQTCSFGNGGRRAHSRPNRLMPRSGVVDATDSEWKGRRG